MPASFCECLKDDFRAMGVQPTWLKMLCWLPLRPRWCAVFLHRCAAYYAGSNRLGRAASRFFWLLNWWLNGCDIDPRATIKSGLNLPHPCGVVIGWATLGSNVTILQNVTIGLSHFRDMDAGIPFTQADLPIIGNKVSIFAGAVLVGAITVGDGAQIGANAVVLKNVPAHSMAVGIPARILPPRD